MNSDNPVKWNICIRASLSMIYVHDQCSYILLSDSHCDHRNLAYAIHGDVRIEWAISPYIFQLLEIRFRDELTRLPRTTIQGYIPA